MNSKLKKRCIRCGALMAATAVVAGIFFQTTLSVEAAMEKMPGIETIVKDNSKDKPFRILELTDNSEDAEIVQDYRRYYSRAVCAEVYRFF